VLLLGLIISPAGAWLRYVITFHNSHTPSFPIYTYACNLLGSVGTTLIYVMLTKVLPANEKGTSVETQTLKQEWLLATSLGFCGTFTTVSSFVHEVYMLRKTHSLYDAYIYGATTIVSVHVVCLAFLLPFSVHFSECEAHVDMTPSL